ncbi:MAG: GFA family protein [Rhizomicrobium sp.]
MSGTVGKKNTRASHGKAVGVCLCGAVHIEIELPAFWAWHDHSRATQRAQGCAYATYIGVWKSRLRVTKGARTIARYEDVKTRTARAFCSCCGTPLFYERRAKMLNIPRALFDGRTGREPRYHRSLDESPDWAYRQEPLGPLKGYPGVLVEKARRKKLPPPDFL